MKLIITALVSGIEPLVAAWNDKQSQNLYNIDTTYSTSVFVFAGMVYANGQMKEPPYMYIMYSNVDVCYLCNAT